MERCCVFSQKEGNIRFEYEVLKKYDWDEESIYTESFRELVRCKECGAFFIHQVTNLDGVNNARFIQVEDEKSADNINETTDAITFSVIEKPSVCKFREEWYFTNLEPVKQLTREEQIEEIKKMTLEEKIEEWEHLYKNLSDFQVHGYSTDGINCVLDVINDILELAELTGGMEEPYKSEYERLIKDYKELYKVREKEETESAARMKKKMDELFGDLDELLKEGEALDKIDEE